MRFSIYDRPRLNISHMVPYIHNVKLTQCVIADQEKAECIVYANEPGLADIPLEYQDVKPEGWWPAGARTSGGKRFVVIRGEVEIIEEKTEYRDLPPGVPLNRPTSHWTYQEDKPPVHTTVIEKHISIDEWEKSQVALENAGFISSRQMNNLFSEIDK